MSDRNKRGEHRGSGRHREHRDRARESYGRAEPWREEHRTRYPDELYGGEPEASRRSNPYGHGYGYGFSDDSRYRSPSQPGWRAEWQERQDDPQRNRGAWKRAGDRERDDRWARGSASGGYGSEFGAWRAGAGFGFGPEEVPRENASFEDTDWIPSRPARGRGTWAADWASGRSGAGEYGSQYGGAYGGGGRPGGASPLREDYRGRGPKDYRRSDDRIREEICDRLTDDQAIDASDVSIKVEAGEVTLSGFVASRDQKRRAEEDAEGVSGAIDVINQLRINRGDLATAPSPQSQQQANRGQRSSSTAQPPSVAANRER
jgi:hypothetical protein